MKVKLVDDFGGSVSVKEYDINSLREFVLQQGNKQRSSKAFSVVSEDGKELLYQNREVVYNVTKEDNYYIVCGILGTRKYKAVSYTSAKHKYIIDYNNENGFAMQVAEWEKYHHL